MAEPDAAVDTVYAEVSKQLDVLQGCIEEVLKEEYLDRESMKMIDSEGAEGRATKSEKAAPITVQHVVDAALQAENGGLLIRQAHRSLAKGFCIASLMYSM